MLCQFTFENFKSFRDEVTLDMQASSVTEQEDKVIADKDEKRFLRTAVIYGPNGGGKSTVLEALKFLTHKIISPYYILKDDESYKNKKIKTDYKPFKFDADSINKPTHFEIYFRTNKNEYKYNLSIYKDKIVSESLYKKAIGGRKPSSIFEREQEQIILGTILKDVRNSEISPSIPFITFLKINYNITVINEVFQWFDSCEFHNYSNPERESIIPYTDDEKIKDTIVKMLREMDIDIVDFRLQEEAEDKWNIYTKHKINNNLEVELKLQEESNGTIKLFGLVPYILDCLLNGKLMIVDELDAKLHPKLLRYIIETFKNPKINTKAAQLIFTSHDLTTMKKDIFRRDEIWFASKNREEASELYSLVEFRDESGNIPRKDATFDKQYLEGRYGADPYLHRMLNWEELV